MPFDQQKINEALSEENPPEWVNDLKSMLSNMIKRSRSKMSNYHSGWKDIDAAFRSERPVPNEADNMAEERDEPQKFTLPFLYSQMQTFISIGESLLGDRESLYELAGNGAEDVMPSLLATSLLERDIRHSDFKHTGLKQFLTNAVRYDMAPIKYSWTQETEMMEVDTPIPGTEGLGLTTQSIQEVSSFQGNSVRPVSPFRFLPDPRVPIYRIQDGEFCGDDFFKSKQELEQDPNTFGVKHIQNASKELLDGVEHPFGEVDISNDQTLKSHVLGTEIQFKIVPSKFREDVNDGEFDGILGEEEVEMTFLAQIANDNRIIRLEQLGYPNNNFTYTVGVISPDEQNFLGAGYAAILWPIQETADWFINSRVEAVRSHVDKQYFVDPSAFEISDLTNRAKVVRLKPEVQMTDIRRYLYEPNISDASASNIGDVETLFQFAKEGTGLTDNLLGQFAGGRRSAREAGNVHANAVQRVKSDIKTLWHTGLKPLGAAMLDNHRLGLDQEQIINIVGVTDQHIELVPTIAAFAPVDKTKIPSRYDFVFTEALLPSEKALAAQTLQEVVTLALQNPLALQLLMSLGYNVGKMVEELLSLKGLKNVSRFKFSQSQLNTISGIITPQSIQASAGVSPSSGGGGTQLPIEQLPQLLGGGNPGVSVQNQPIPGVG